MSQARGRPCLNRSLPSLSHIANGSTSMFAFYYSSASILKAVLAPGIPRQMVSSVRPNVSGFIASCRSDRQFELNPVFNLAAAPATNRSPNSWAIFPQASLTIPTKAGESISRTAPSSLIASTRLPFSCTVTSTASGRLWAKRIVHWVFPSLIRSCSPMDQLAAFSRLGMCINLLVRRR